MEGKAKTPAGRAERMRRLIGCLRKAKSCTELDSVVTSGSAPLSHLFVFRLG
ncbi:hypothetical protein [Priestia megaterium]|uniref:hypothetical protein n=1 Tax=Priestia megaterium TaxID=1404 RepID=UPI003CE711AA